MTHQYTKLADELDAVNDVCGSRSIREAARILRAAAGVDVAGLMDVADRYALAQADPAHWRAALESALRLALAASPEDQIIELAQALEQRRALAITDAVHNLPIGGRTANMPTAFQAGYCAACEEIEHRLRTEEWTHCLKPVGAAAPKGTYPQEDRSREPPCHACGLGYKCRSANCPNTTPDPMTGPHRKEHHDQP